MKQEKASILLIENDNLLCDLIQLSLEQEGYSVIVLRSGKEVLNTIERVHPNLVLLDIFLPQTQTIQLIEQIQQLPPPKVNIIVLSAFSFREVVQKALDAGAKEYLLKPIDTVLLMQRVGKLLAITPLPIEKEQKVIEKPVFRTIHNK